MIYAAHFPGNNMGKSGLAQTGRTEDKGVIQRFLAAASRIDEDFHPLTDLGLAMVVRRLAGRIARSCWSPDWVTLPAVISRSLSMLAVIRLNQMSCVGKALKQLA